MKIQKTLRNSAVIFFLLAQLAATAQSNKVNTIFRGGVRSSGGYGALTNKFTRIAGEHANIAGIYGGWFVNHKFMIGVEGAAVTNDIRVPVQHSVDPLRDLSYEYGQAGLAMEYVIGSGKAVHLALHLFAGAGFTLQYQRHGWDRSGYSHDKAAMDEDWFVVTEPGIQLEVNVFKWMRLSPGVSYRATYGSDGRGLGDNKLSGVSYNATVKFGHF